MMQRMRRKYGSMVRGIANHHVACISPERERDRSIDRRWRTNQKIKREKRAITQKLTRAKARRAK